MVQVGDSHFCTFPMYLYSVSPRSCWNLKSRNDRHDRHTPAPMGPAQGGHGKNEFKFPIAGNFCSFSTFPVRGNFCSFCSICGQIQFSARVSCDKQLCWKLASLRSKIRPYMCIKILAHQKGEIHHFCEPKFATFYHCKMAHIWAAFRRLHRSAQ